MKILRSYESGSLKVRVDTLEDMWSMQRIIFSGDIIKSESERKFKSDEGDEGEMKKVFITLKVEKTELDKTALRLRLAGKIVDGRPLEYVRLKSYHTINISCGDVFEVIKDSWPEYIGQVVKNAVLDNKRPRLGIIVVDDEKALPAYLLGYGLEFRNEIYSNLSKRLSPKDFGEQQKKYFSSILKIASEMRVETIIIAGPGFTKDDIKKCAEDDFAFKNSGKKLMFLPSSNSERSGVYELIRSKEVEVLLSKERIRSEFILMERFLSGISSKLSKYGIDNVRESVESFSAKTLIVNDSMLGDAQVQYILSMAERNHIEIVVFNSEDEAGSQLQSFKGIASIE